MTISSIPLMSLLSILILACCMITLPGCVTENDSSQNFSQKHPDSPFETIRKNLSDLPAVRDIQTWENEFAPGIIISTLHYDIYTTLPDPLMLRQIPAFIESAYQAYQKQLPAPIETQTRFRVYLFAERDQWEQFTRDFASPNADIYLNIRKGAYYLNDACVAYNIGRTETFAALAHEGWHHFTSRHFTLRLPSWLDEGVATVFESSENRNGGFEFRADRNFARLAALKQTIMAGRTTSLSKLITLNPSQLIESSEDMSAFYAQSYALVRFLREDQYGKKLADYQRMLLGGLEGTWPIEPGLKAMYSDRNRPLTTEWNSIVSVKLFRMYIEDDINLIEDRYKMFCRKIVYPLAAVRTK